MSVTIKPEVGRTLYYYPHASERLSGSPGPLAAKVVHVHSDALVNLVVWDSNGNAHPKTSVTLVQPNNENPASAYAAWMPYQVESAERAAKFAAMKEDFAKVTGDVKTCVAKEGMKVVNEAMSIASLPTALASDDNDDTGEAAPKQPCGGPAPTQDKAAPPADAGGWLPKKS